MRSPASLLRYLRWDRLWLPVAVAVKAAGDARHAYAEGAFDRKYGTDTGGVIDDMTELGVGGAHAEHAYGYEAIQLGVFRRIMAELDIAPPDYTFVDFGSGKGRAIMLAAERGFARVHGVEFSPVLHEIATRNCARLRRKLPMASPISLHCLDAVEFEIPPGDLVCFLYNPFDGVVMRAVLSNIAAACSAAPRRVIVAYRNSSCPDVFEAFPFLRPVAERSSYTIYFGPPAPPEGCGKPSLGLA